MKICVGKIKIQKKSYFFFPFRLNTLITHTHANNENKYKNYLVRLTRLVVKDRNFDLIKTFRKKNSTTNYRLSQVYFSMTKWCLRCWWSSMCIHREQMRSFFLNEEDYGDMSIIYRFFFSLVVCLKISYRFQSDFQWNESTDFFSALFFWTLLIEESIKSFFEEKKPDHISKTHTHTHTHER